MSERIRLVKFLNVFGIGGTERQFVNVVKRLDRSRFDVHVACLWKRGAFLPEVEACGDPVTEFRIHSFHNLETIRAQFRFARYLRQKRIQVVHTYGYYTNVFAIPAAWMAGVPVIVASIRDTGAHLTPVQRRVQRAVCAMANCVLANADAVRDWLIREGYPAKYIRVVPNGIVTPGRSEQQPGQFRRDFGIPAGVPLIGVICRLNSVKAVNYFIDAAALLADKYPEARFAVIGDGPDRSALQLQAALKGLQQRITFAGSRNDIESILKELTVSVLCSLTEGLSNTLLESMASGVPVVATRVGGTPEIVRDGINGFLVEPRDTPGLSNAIARLLEDPALAQRMGHEGCRLIEREFSLEQTVRRTESLYSELLSSSLQKAA